MARNPSHRTAVLGALIVLGTIGCRELESFSTGADQEYRGTIVNAEHLRRGDDTTVPAILAPETTMTLTLDVGRLQSDVAGGAGSVTTSDGLLTAASLLPIGKLWNDTLSGLTFPEGRLRSVLYFVRAADSAPAPHAGALILLVLSLMVDGSVEVRLIGGPDPSGLYGLFRLRKTTAGGG